MSSRICTAFFRHCYSNSKNPLTPSRKRGEGDEGSARLGRVDDDERAAGERGRCPVGQQHLLKTGAVARGLLVIGVEDAVAIEEQVHRLGNANASLGGGPAE